MSELFPICVWLSGSGRTLKNLLDLKQAGSLPIDVRHVISSRTGVYGIEIAKQAGLPCTVVRKRDFASAVGYSEEMFRIVRESGAKLVVMAGFLQHALIPDDYLLKVINIHPSLIPAFCGAGFYGHHVHEAVLAYGAKISGCTAHFVDNDYDHGPVILQRSCDVLDDDTPDRLAARVFELECQVLPEAIRLFVEGRLSIDGRRVTRRA